MNVLIIGNSHIAAIKTGWDYLNGELASIITPTFAAARGRGLEAFKCEGTIFQPTTELSRNELRFTSGGLEYIDFNDYAAIVTAGLYFGRYRLVKNLSRHRTEELLPQKPPRYLISEEVQNLTIEKVIRRGFCAKTAAQFRKATKAPIFAFEQPMPRQAVLIESNRKGKWRFAKRLRQQINDIWSRETGKLREDYDFHVLNQPEATLTEDGLTLDEFGIGSTRLREGFDEEHRDNEFLHMNARYGALILRQLADKLQAIA